MHHLPEDMHTHTQRVFVFELIGTASKRRTLRRFNLLGGFTSRDLKRVADPVST